MDEPSNQQAAMVGLAEFLRNMRLKKVVVNGVGVVTPPPPKPETEQPAE